MKPEDKLLHFVIAVTDLCERKLPEPDTLQAARRLMAELVAQDDWLSPQFATPDPERYRQNLLYGDPRDRFSLVSFVWGPGQRTPIHDHTVWGVVGVLRGAEQCQSFAQSGDRMAAAGEPALLLPGDVTWVSPAVGDVHEVSNPLTDQASISIHLYGGNIGRIRRSVFSQQGERREFVSGYSNSVLPNLWP